MHRSLDINHPFFDRFNELMKEKIENGHTVREISIKTNLRADLLSMYMCRKIMPTVISVERISNYFGVSIDWLLGRTDRR